MKSILLAAGLSLLAAAVPAAAEDAPFSQLQIIVGATPGGGYDLTARAVEKTLLAEKLVSVPIVVENRPGAGGAVAWASMNRFAGNPAYISPMSASMISADLQNVAGVKIEEFTPIAMLITEDLCIGLNPKGSIKTIQQLVDEMKKDPEQVRLGFSTAIGTQNHIAIALLADAVGVDIKKLRTAVFKSAGESTVALLGNNIDVSVSGLATYAPYQTTGELSCAAIASDHRAAPPYDNIPTLKELGIPVSYSSYRGFIAPKGLSPEALKYWETTINAMRQTKTWKEITEKNLWSDYYMNSADMKAFLLDQRAKTKKILTNLGIISG